MRFKIPLICIILTLLSCAGFAQDKVVLQTEDRWKLEALYNPAENGKSVILLHDLGRR